MIKAIFYSKFDTQEGPKVVHQVPDGAIVPSTTAPSQEPFFRFSDISFFVIPRQELCGNLIQACTNGFRILGYPICMKSPQYNRNEFIFNFCIVLSEDEEFNTYKSVVQKLADLMHGLEEQSGFLSRDHSRSGEGKVYSLCETLMEDLNNYCECMIPIDELNTLNIKLFPIYPNPPLVKAWQVPLFTVRYQAFMDENWDLTLQRIVPHINGVNSIKIISILADTDFSLTCRAIRHLLYYGCLFLLDIFSFSAIYAPTSQFSSTIASDEAMQQECARYINTRFAPPSINVAPSPVSVGGLLSSPHSEIHPNIWRAGGYSTASVTVWPLVGSNGESSNGSSKAVTEGVDMEGHLPEVVDGVGIVELYASLRQGQSVKQWYMKHSEQLANIDIRRFITFGIIKGFLYRVHKYAFETSQPAPAAQMEPRAGSTHANASTTGKQSDISSRSRNGTSFSSSARDGNNNNTRSPTDNSPPLQTGRHGDISEKSASYRSTYAHDYGPSHGDTYEDEDEKAVDNKTLSKYLDGMHCFDQICTELEISEKELTARLKRYPYEVLIIHR